MLKLSYPLHTQIHIVQPFGNDPAYYSKFGWKGHPGIDFQAPHATPVYAPSDGLAYYVSDTHGGHGIYIHTKDDAGNWYNLIHWHLIGHDDPTYAPVIPQTGFYPVKEGALIGYADNSGAPYESSGDHLHFGVQPCNANYTALDSTNGMGGCVDPAPFLPPPQAEAANVVEQSIQTATQILTTVAQSNQPMSFRQELLDELKKVVEKLTTLL